MPKQSEVLDRIFHSLADLTRRSVLLRLARGPVHVSELSKPFSMSLPTFTQHLGVLESTGLVRSRKRGRVRTYSLAPNALRPAERWLDAQRSMWEKRLNQLDSFLNSLNAMENA